MLSSPFRYERPSRLSKLSAGFRFSFVLEKLRRVFQMRAVSRFAHARALALLLAVVAMPRPVQPQQQQKLSGLDRDRGREMLELIKNDIKKNYYDSTFHGVDLDAHLKKANDKFKQDTSLGQLFV